ncbi:MAG: type II/IV secretion system protein [Chloroflexi bacterium]|nr:type II/IV secretion system protein [Chloroflexota bacterium]
MNADPKILLIGAPIELVRNLGRFLSQEGYQPVPVSSLAEAVASLPKQRIAMAMVYPHEDPARTGEIIHALRSASSLPILVLLPNQAADQVTNILRQGSDGIIHLPFDSTALRTLLTSYLDTRAGGPQTDGRNTPAAKPSPPSGRNGSDIDLRTQVIDPNILKLVPENIARRYNCLPLRVEGQLLFVAMPDPPNLQAMEDLWILTRKTIKPIPAPVAELQSAINMHYRRTGELERQIEQLLPEAQIRIGEPESSPDIVVDTPLVRTLDLLVAQAVKEGVSDIHIEPQETHLRIRYRVDGILHDTMSLPMSVHGPLVSRLKILADMNIAERRRFQDGNFTVLVDNKQVDIRAATANTTWGEMAVLRVLDKSLSVKELKDLGFSPGPLELYRRALDAPFGMILVSGPTGSGKTTTLYGSINTMDRKSLNIMTIEDPVEYKFGDINQIQVNRRADINFASGLRATMRLDPDVILVGEIRDRETAETAVQAALTGHLVLSSVHANDSVGVIFRMLDLGVEPFLLNTSLVAVVAQRLVRRVHKDCSHLAPASPDAIIAYERITGKKSTEFAYGQGCPYCNQIGYKGRVAVFEVLVLTESIRRLLSSGASADEIKRQAVAEGMISMAHDGMLKADAGLTTPEEVLVNVFSIL